ncbi:MAG: ankyrin repeat domain-containing protein, partial [Chlamydiia bacterium]|nr:ankyrin repeat domain-containing protein [Chlamydiia bacterium]
MQSVSLFSLPPSESPPLIGPRSSDSIIEAIVAGDVTMAMDLVKHSDPECLDWSPTHTCTPLHQAALYGNADLVEAILDAMPSEAVDLQDGGGRTALHWALELNHRACAHAILPRTSSDALSLLDGYNRTPLHLAARTGDLASVEGILERMHPKDITARDRSGNAAIEHAIRCGNRKCARAISRVLDISQAPPWAWQEAIATAIRSNDRKMLCYLLDAKGPNGSLDGMLLLR